MSHDFVSANLQVKAAQCVKLPRAGEKWPMNDRVTVIDSEIYPCFAGMLC